MLKYFFRRLKATTVTSIIGKLMMAICLVLAVLLVCHVMKNQSRQKSHTKLRNFKNHYPSQMDEGKEVFRNFIFHNL